MKLSLFEFLMLCVVSAGVWFGFIDPLIRREPVIVQPQPVIVYPTQPAPIYAVPVQPTSNVQANIDALSTIAAATVISMQQTAIAVSLPTLAPTMTPLPTMTANPWEHITPEAGTPDHFDSITPGAGTNP